jgi:hypothetical protein
MARRKRTPVGDSPTRAKVVYRITYPNVSRYSPLTHLGRTRSGAE